MIGTGIGMLIAGLAAGGSSVYGAKKGSSAAKQAAKLTTESANRAAEIQAASNREAIDYAKQVDRQNQTNFDTTQALNLDQYNQREARLTPLRDLGAQGVSTLSNLVRTGTGTDYLPPPASRGIFG